MNAGVSEPRREGLSPGANESGRGSRGDVSCREGGREGVWEEMSVGERICTYSHGSLLLSFCEFCFKF